MRHWLLAALATLLAACSSAPETKESAPVVAPVATNAPAARTAQPATMAATQGAAATGSGSMQVGADQPSVTLARPGFRARTRNGATVWCRSETPTGSRMPVESCYTAAQLDQIQSDTAAIKDSINNTRTPCAGPGCSNGS